MRCIQRPNFNSETQNYVEKCADFSHFSMLITTYLDRVRVRLGSTIVKLLTFSGNIVKILLQQN